MITSRQNALYWREWAAAKRALMPGRETWTKLEENERRHDITIEALGRDKSHLEFTNADFDKVLGALRAISKPGDLNAQIRQARQQDIRARYVLDRLMVKLGKGRNYVQGVIDKIYNDDPAPDLNKLPLEERAAARWQRERARDSRPRKLMENLTADEMKPVLNALREQVKRRRNAAPAEVPF